MSKNNPSQRKKLKLKKMQQLGQKVGLTPTDEQLAGVSYEWIFKLYTVLAVIGIIVLTALCLFGCSSAEKVICFDEIIGCEVKF